MSLGKSLIPGEVQEAGGPSEVRREEAKRVSRLPTFAFGEGEEALLDAAVARALAAERLVLARAAEDSMGGGAGASGRSF